LTAKRSTTPADIKLAFIGIIAGTALMKLTGAERVNKALPSTTTEVAVST
jgi:hypothetical protein